MTREKNPPLNKTSHAELVSASSTQAVLPWQQQRQTLKTLKQVQGDFRINTVGGFTLLELLVVVLIIGILAAVAVPQYQKAVWKSKTVQLLTTIKALATAQEVYHMENGTYAAAFSELDISLDNLPLVTSIGTPATSSDDAVRGNEDFEIIINTASSGLRSRGQFHKGPYAGGGYSFVHTSTDADLPAQKLYCTEVISFFPEEGKFCKQISSGSTKIKDIGGMRFYQLP